MNTSDVLSSLQATDTTNCGRFYRAMKEWVSDRWIRMTEFVYAVVALFSLTQGPVYRLWAPSAVELGRLPEPSMAHVYFATFVSMQLPAFWLFSRRVDAQWLRDRGNQALAAFVGWLGLSVGWSAFARESLPEYVALALTTVFGLYLAESFSSRQFWMIVASAMALGVGTAWFSVMRLWDGAVNFQENYWVGIYYNRNSFAPVAAVAIIAAVGVVSSTDYRRNLKSLAKIVPVLVLVAFLTGFAATEMWKSKSKTSPLALAVAVSICVAWMVTRALCAKIRFLHKIQSITAPTLIASAGVVIFVTLRQIGHSTVVSSDLATLSSRRALWSLSWSGIMEKPLYGWGWMAAWHTTDFFRSGQWWAIWNSQWSHNGYHDVLLGGGFPAGVLFATVIWCGSQRATTGDARRSLPLLALVVFVLTAATQESFFIGSHFAWALLIAAFAVPSAGTESSGEEQHASKGSA